MPRQPARLTQAELEAGKSAKGGYTARQLRAWGIPWPPPKGWQQVLLGEADDFGAAAPTGREMQARHDSMCEVCARPIGVGEWIVEGQEDGWVHRTCART